MTSLSKQHITTFKDAAKKLTGAKRRAFQAQVTTDYLKSKPRLAENTFGWDRNTVLLGLNELRTGIVCVDNFKARGNKKTEAKNPQLEVDIVTLAEPQSQTDPKFQTAFKYTRISSHRTQFMKRPTEFADQHDLEIVLAYYPPYHSKYNPIERCWEILEKQWSATLLNTVETTVEWAKSMTWKGSPPVVELLKTIYKKNVTMGKKAFQAIADRLTRHPSLPKYSLTIKSQAG